MVATERMTDHIDSMALAVFEGYRSDMRGARPAAEEWEGLSSLEKGHWRRAARAAYRFLEIPA
jgi:uncharacterized protein HemY